MIRVKDGYITVSEYAQVTGTTRQSVYQRIKRGVNDLSQHCKREGNQIFIDISVLSEDQRLQLDCQRLSTFVNAECKRPVNVCKRSDNAENGSGDQVIDALRDQIRILEDQVRDQREEISNQREQLRQMMELLQSSDARLHDLSDLLKAQSVIAIGKPKQNIFKRLLRSFQRDPDDGSAE